MGFNEKLQKVRKKNNLSQERLAEILNVSRQAISKWENGEVYPEIDKLIKISNLFNVSLDSLLKEKNSECCIINDDTLKRDLDRNRIIEFLCKAKRETYASSNNKVKSSRTNSNDLEYIEENMKYIDSYLGSERFIGEEAIWIDEKPYWAMNYSGRVLGENFSGSFLKEVLSKVNEKIPYRGPIIYEKGDYKYHFMIDGDFEWVKGVEEIYFKDKKIYECIVHGGLIK